MNQDIAAGQTVLGTFAPVQLYAGEAPIITGDYELATDVVKYQVVAVDATGKVVEYAADLELVIASQPGVTGDRIAFFEGGYFNHEALVWPESLTTYEERRAVFGSSGSIKIGRLVN